jgi:hypothetical protein
MWSVGCGGTLQTNTMPKVKVSVRVYGNVFEKRRSSRHGKRRSLRRVKKVKRKRSLDLRIASYDRDFGGYNAWGSAVKRTTRESGQIRKENALVRKLAKNKRMTRTGYARDDFLAGDDIEVKNDTFQFDTDDVLDLADAQEAASDSDSDGQPDLEWDSSSDDSDAPQGS